MNGDSISSSLQYLKMLEESISIGAKSLSSTRDGNESRSSLWTLHMFRLYAILALGYLCIVLQGYDGSLMPSINAMVSVHEHECTLSFRVSTNCVCFNLDSLNISSITDCKLATEERVIEHRVIRY